MTFVPNLVGMSHLPPTATLLGPLNCQAAIGLPWRRVRELAVRHGVRRVKVGRATLVPLAGLLAVIESGAAADNAESADPREVVLAALGRKTG